MSVTLQPYSPRPIPTPSGYDSLLSWAIGFVAWLGVELRNLQRGIPLTFYPILPQEVGKIALGNAVYPYGYCQRYGATTTGDNTQNLRNMLLSAVALGVAAVTDIAVPCSSKLTIPSLTRHWHTGAGSWVFNWLLASGQGGSVFVENDAPVTGNADIEMHNLTVKGPWPDDGGPFGQGRIVSGVLVAPAGGVLFRRVDGLRVRACNITNIPGISFGYQGVRNFQFSDFVISRSGRDGLTGWWFGAGWNLENGTITNVLCERVGDDGIAFHASSAGLPNTDKRPTGITLVGAKVKGWAGLVTLASATVATTATSQIATATASVFTSDDLAKSITIAGAGPAGAPLSTYILAIISPTQVKLGVAANTTVAAGAAVYSFGAGRGFIADGCEDITATALEVYDTFAQGVAVTSDGVAGSSLFRSRRISVNGKSISAGQLGDGSQPQYGCELSRADYCTVDLQIAQAAGKGGYATDVVLPKIRGQAIGNGKLITDFGWDLDGVVSPGNVLDADVDVQSVGNAGGGVRSHFAPYSRIDGTYNDNGQAGAGTDSNGSGIVHSGDHTMIVAASAVARDTRAAGSRTQTHPLTLQNSGGAPTLILEGGAFQTGTGGNNVTINNASAIVMRRGVNDQATANLKNQFDQAATGTKNYPGYVGDPNGVLSAAANDTAWRHDGAAGTRLYVCTGGTVWSAIAGI